MATVHHLKKFSHIQLESHLKKQLSIQYQTISLVTLPYTNQKIKILSMENVIFYKQSTISHLTIICNQTSQEKYRIICRGMQKPVRITKPLLRQYMGKPSISDKRIKELGNIINKNYVKKSKENHINISIHPLVEDDDLVYLSYIEEIHSFALVNKDALTLMSYQQISNKVGIEGQLEKWICGLTQEQRVQLIYQLSNNTLIGKREQHEIKFFLIVSNSIGQTHSLQTTKHLFQKFNSPIYTQMLSEGQKYEDYEDIGSKIQSYIEAGQNSYDLENKIVRVLKNSFIVVQLLVLNKELLIYERMKQSITKGEQFITEQGRFPKLYYSKIFPIYKEFYHQLTKFRTYQAIKLVLYSQQMCLPLGHILQSALKKQIIKIHYSQFQNCAISTFLVYLIIGPSGMGKTQMISLLKQKVQKMECQSIALKMTNHQRLQWQSKDLQKFMTREQIFDHSQYSFIFLDFPFHPDIPSIIEQSVSSMCPQNRHYKILHVMPECSQPFSFENEILNKQITFPFEVNFLLNCLKSIEKRGQGYNKKLQPIQNLSKLIHNISFSFRNFREQLFEGTRLRTIKINYKVQFRQIVKSLIISLQELLEMSYKKEYAENQHILYYFLEELENLQILQIPNLQIICESILMYSFRRLPYYQIP